VTPSLLRSLLVGVVLAPVYFYQACLRPVLPAVCRFYPSCSEYFIQAVHLYGPVRGSYMGVRRICRCHPWHPGGFDPP
jgi:putative membrane protein insertion efficiency factor